MFRSVMLGALVSAALVAGAATASTPPPFFASAVKLELPLGDSGEHLCPGGYLLSVTAQTRIDNSNVRVVFIDRNHNALSTGAPLSGVAGFKLARPVAGIVDAAMICG